MSRARRYNKGKLRHELIPTTALNELAKVYTLGAHKYSIYRDKDGKEVLGSDIPFDEVGKYELVDDASKNWRKGLSWMETMGAVKRHIAAWNEGEDNDSEFKITYHLAHAMWGLATLIDYYKSYPQGDDRVHKYLSRPKIGLDIDGCIASFDQHLCNTAGIAIHDIHHWNDPIIKKHYKEIRSSNEFWLSMPVLTKPSDIPFEVHCYITSRNVDPEITQQWLDNNGFPHAPLYCVGDNHSKVETAKKSGVEIFVDDKYENFVELNNAGICCYLFDQPHNRKYEVSYKRIYSLKELG